MRTRWCPPTARACGDVADRDFDVLGLIPIAPTVFWGPMAFAIMGGLLVATMLTLVLLPTIYITWFHGKEGAADARAASAPSSSA